jgi:hypothetical protein
MPLSRLQNSSPPPLVGTLLLLLYGTLQAMWVTYLGSQVPVSLSCVNEALFWHTADHMDHIPGSQVPVSSLHDSPVATRHFFGTLQATWTVDHLPGFSSTCLTLLWWQGFILAHCRPCGSPTWVASASLLVAVLPHVGTVLRHAACHASRLGQNSCNKVS